MEDYTIGESSGFGHTWSLAHLVCVCYCDSIYFEFPSVKSVCLENDQ